jgi:hypothetical protein
MAWFKVDDSFPNHPKVLAIPATRRYAAVGLWTLAGNWAAKYLTDGMLPPEAIGSDAKDVRKLRGLCTELARVSLWHPPGHTCERCPEVPSGYYLFHDWTDYQPTRAKVEADRRKTAAKVAAWRARKAALEGSNVTLLRPTAGPSV